MFATIFALGNEKIKKIKVYKSGGSYACPLKNNRSISYLQVRRYSTSLVGINGFLGPYLAGLIEGDGYIGVQDPYTKAKVVYRPKIIIAFRGAV